MHFRFLDVADDRLEQVPVVRRTIIVEPYPASPTSKVVVKPKDTSGKKTKKKKKPTTGTADIHLEDVNDDGPRSYATSTKRARVVANGARGTRPGGKNTFYN